MAGDWIKLRTDLERDPRVQTVAVLLAVDADLIVGKLARFWSYVSEHSEDGRLPSMACPQCVRKMSASGPHDVQGVSRCPHVVDSILRLEGFSEALESVGWLTFEGPKPCVPRWEEHNSGSAKRRARDSLRKEVGRKADKKRTGVRIDLDKRPSDSKSNSSSDSSSLEGGSAERGNSFEPQPAAFHLAELLRTKILERKPDAKVPAGKLTDWALHIDRMIRIDKRNAGRIAQVIVWAQSDTFWCSNIMSASKLREKFDTLEGQMERPRNPKAGQHSRTAAEVTMDNVRAMLTEDDDQ